MKLGTSAIVAGLGLLMLVICAPYAELYVYPKLVVAGNAAQTGANIKSNEFLFVTMLLSYLVTYIIDIVVAWALYIYLSPVSKPVSMLAALFRIVYSIIGVVALLNLVTVYNLTVPPGNNLYNQVMFYLDEFRTEFHFCILFFAIHLLILGYLAIKAKYIPGIMGIFLIISGLGYLASSLKPFLFRNVNLDFAVYTFFGELIFMVWLLWKGSRTKEMV